MEKGLFVTLEGGEGAGKSTLQTELAKRFTDAGREVITTREPGGSDLGQKVRDWVLDHHQISPRAELLLFLADRAQHVDQVIMPALQQGKVVLCDRYVDSSIAYQGYGRKLGPETVAQLCDFATGGLKPAVTLLLDVSPEKGLERAPGSDRMESEQIAFHYKIRKGFLEMASEEPERFAVIDATATAEEVADMAWEILEKRSVFS